MPTPTDKSTPGATQNTSTPSPSPVPLAPSTANSQSFDTAGPNDDGDVQTVETNQKQAPSPTPKPTNKKDDKKEDYGKEYGYADREFVDNLAGQVKQFQNDVTIPFAKKVIHYDELQEKGQQAVDKVGQAASSAVKKIDDMAKDASVAMNNAFSQAGAKVSNWAKDTFSNSDKPSLQPMTNKDSSQDQELKDIDFNTNQSTTGNQQEEQVQSDNVFAPGNS
ncbi:hypothetical protein ACNVED_14235 [Legionella sp. D16C41]|uniref:hypothetical protein n=1 Tax=Legionella sp. D16C41 TaxID=3402688 RepID=UPI003AF52710